MAEGLYRFSADYYYGEVEGLFFMDSEDINKLIGHTWYIGEVLGKHSEVAFDIDKDTFKLITNHAMEIRVIKQIFNYKEGGYGSLVGYSPIDFLEELEEEDDTS